MAKNPSIPYQLLKEFIDKKVKVEANCGEVYRGILLDVEENLSVSLSEIKATLADGSVVKMKGAYIRGRRIRLIKLPSSAADYLPRITRPPKRIPFRGGFRGRRGGGRPSFGRR